MTKELGAPLLFLYDIAACIWASSVKSMQINERATKVQKTEEKKLKYIWKNEK
jgi:hypothetical protein